MNLLTDKLPSAVLVDGKNYTIFTDFQSWISFFELIENRDIADDLKMILAMKLFKDEVPPNKSAALCSLYNFAACGDVPRAGKQNPEAPEESGTKKPCLSWLYDAPFVIGAFKSVYDIDLIENTGLHWYKFFALFMALPDDTPIKQRMSLRQTRAGEIKDKERRRRIRAAQRAIAIPCPVMTAEQIGAAFM